MFVASNNVGNREITNMGILIWEFLSKFSCSYTYLAFKHNWGYMKTGLFGPCYILRIFTTYTTQLLLKFFFNKQNQKYVDALLLNE